MKKLSFKEFLLKEARVGLNDPAMDDMFDDQGEPTPAALGREGPYAVGWSAQSHEWYGDEAPASGRGRYKPKFDGGEIVAINVPDRATADKIGRELEASYEDGSFYDKSVYAKWGKDWYVNQWHGVWIRPMNKVEDYEIEHAQRNPRVKNFAK